MHSFHYKNGELYAEDVPVRDIVAGTGTPVYIYSHRALLGHFLAYEEAFAGVPHITCFALKANSNLSILKLFGDMGSGADVVSGGELFRALRAGIPADRIVYAGVGKSREEIAYALKSDILMFNVESPQELQVISEVATNMGVDARVALRINPDVDPQTHPYIATGLRESKFGIDISQAVEEYRLARELPRIRVVGIHQHIGSQITEVGPFVDALGKIAELARELRALGVAIRYLDVGGGLGITYKDEEPPPLRVFAEALIGVVRDLECTIVLEPGRVIVGNAGILVTRVLYTKQTPTQHFLVVDAGMNDLIRPSLYGSYHAIIPVHRMEGRPTRTVDVVGPICESGDFLAKDRELPEVKAGDLLAVMSAGAYGFTMASNYNARPRVPEVLGKGHRYLVIRKRETYEDLIRGEEVPEEL